MPMARYSDDLPLSVKKAWQAIGSDTLVNMSALCID